MAVGKKGAKNLACSVKISVEDILKYFSYLSQKTDFRIWHKFCMECQSLFSGTNKKIAISLSYAECGQREVMVKVNRYTFKGDHSDQTVFASLLKVSYS